MDAIGTGNIKNTKDVSFSTADLALLKYVKLITLNSAETQDADVQAMRDAGWTDEQIWETTLEVGMFSLLNRMADAHGLDYPASGWLPPQQRPPVTPTPDSASQSSVPSDAPKSPPHK